MRRTALALTAFGVGLAALLGWQGADAHAVLLRATPPATQTLAESPAQVELLFSEPLDPVFSSVMVTNQTRKRVDANDSHVDAANDHLLIASLNPGLPAGVYTVSWRSLSSIDVHPDGGSYSLFVGVPVSTQAAASAAAITATPETTLGRWWFYLAASLFGGALAAWKVAFGPALGDSRRGVVGRRVHALVVVGGALLIVGTLFSAVAQAAAAAEVPLGGAFGKPIADLLLRGRFASIWWPRLGLEIGSLLLVGVGGIEGLASECALATLPAVLLTSALTSHGAALGSVALAAIFIDWVHILGATAWVGGLVALIVSLPAAGEVGLVTRFGRFALAASALVLLSGLVQSGLELNSWAALTATLYGQLVLVKAALLAAMLLLAMFNELQARRPGSAAASGLRSGARVELGLGVLVLAVAAMLSGTPPSPSSGI